MINFVADILEVVATAICGGMLGLLTFYLGLLLLGVG